MISTGAKIDKEAIAERKCFLCGENRPKEQNVMDAMGTFEVLVNPFPILQYHFTLPLKEHTPQLLGKMFVDMLHVAREWNGMALFYNGAKCGASAPDHAHLQAVRRSDIPLLDGSWDEKLEMEPVYASCDGEIYKVSGYVVPFFVITSANVSTSLHLFELLQSAMPVVEGECEPRMNVITSFISGEGFVTVLFPRAEHRPSCYYAESASQRVVSPGTLDMAGLMIVPRESDYAAITADEAAGILGEVALPGEAIGKIVENLVSVNDED